MGVVAGRPEWPSTQGKLRPALRTHGHGHDHDRWYPASTPAHTSTGAARRPLKNRDPACSERRTPAARTLAASAPPRPRHDPGPRRRQQRSYHARKAHRRGPLTRRSPSGGVAGEGLRGKWGGGEKRTATSRRGVRIGHGDRAGRADGDYVEVAISGGTGVGGIGGGAVRRECTGGHLLGQRLHPHNRPGEPRRHQPGVVVHLRLLAQHDDSRRLSLLRQLQQRRDGFDRPRQSRRHRRASGVRAEPDQPRRRRGRSGRRIHLLDRARQRGLPREPQWHGRQADRVRQPGLRHRRRRRLHLLERGHHRKRLDQPRRAGRFELHAVLALRRDGMGSRDRQLVHLLGHGRRHNQPSEQQRRVAREPVGTGAAAASRHRYQRRRGRRRGRLQPRLLDVGDQRQHDRPRQSQRLVTQRKLHHRRRRAIRHRG